MTMQNAPHPDDERLAAYAGGDADALADRALTEHLTACDRCRPIVDELTLLLGALDAMPDIAPSRPLRLIPPVPAPAALRVGPLEWLRRLAAPAMAAGAGLVLIGAVGASGIAGQLISKDAGRTTTQEAGATDTAGAPMPGAAGSSIPAPGTANDGSAFGSRSDEPRSETDRASASRAPASSVGQSLFEPISGSPGEQPWLTLLIAGIALFAASTLLRYSLAPRAG